MKKTLWLFLISFFLLNFFCCGLHYRPPFDLDRLPLRERHKSFTYKAIKEGKIALGGIVSVFENISRSKRQKYDRIFRKAVKSLKEYNIISSSVIEKALTQKNYEKMLNYYLMNDKLSPFWFKKLKKRVKGIRYIIFGCIRKDEIERITYAPSDPHIKMKKTARSLFVEYRIYDLELNIIATEGSAGQRFETDYEDSATFPKFTKKMNFLFTIFRNFGKRLPIDPEQYKQRELQKKMKNAKQDDF